MDLNQLFKNIPEAMVVVSADGYKILAATDAYLKVTMSRLDDILGKRFLLEAFPDRDVPYEQNPVKLSLDKVLKTKEKDCLDVLRYDLPRPESEGGGYDIRYWEATHTPVLTGQGEVDYIIQHTQDVTNGNWPGWLYRKAKKNSGLWPKPCRSLFLPPTPRASLLI